MTVSSERGFSLMEVVVAVGVLTAGVLTAAGTLAAGMRQLGGSTADVIVTQKAAQAIETVFAARDSHKLTWSQVRNVAGASGADGGVFLDGAQPMTRPGVDGLLNTADDPSAVESNILPGKDHLIGTADDQTVPLTGFTREIQIRDVPGEGGQLRSITVIITYQSGSQQRTYTLTTYISAYA